MTIDSDYATFTLRLTGIDLDNLHPNDVGLLLSHFARLLDDENLQFDTIRQGSAVLSIRTESQFYPQILHNFQNSTTNNTYKSLSKLVQKYKNRFPNIQAEFWAKPNLHSDNQLIETLNFQEQSRAIQQTETLIGQLKSPDHRKHNDTFTLLLANGETATIKVPKSLSCELAKHMEGLWLANHLIEFTGIATYQMTGWKMKLSGFTAQSFNILPNDNQLAKWANDFFECGESGWQTLDNPEQTWLMERHSL